MWRKHTDADTMSCKRMYMVQQQIGILCNRPAQVVPDPADWKEIVICGF